MTSLLSSWLGGRLDGHGRWGYINSHVATTVWHLCENWSLGTSTPPVLVLSGQHLTHVSSRFCQVEGGEVKKIDAQTMRKAMVCPLCFHRRKSAELVTNDAPRVNADWE